MLLSPPELSGSERFLYDAERFEWEERVLFPVFERVAGRNAGLTTRLLERQHRQLEQAAGECAREFSELLRENRARKKLVYRFLKDYAAREDLTLAQLLNCGLCPPAALPSKMGPRDIAAQTTSAGHEPECLVAPGDRCR